MKHLKYIVLLCVAIAMTGIQTNRAWAEEAVAKSECHEKGERKRQEPKIGKRNERKVARKKHIVTAIKHLRAAGMHEEADRLRRTIKGRDDTSAELSERLDKLESRLEQMFDEIGELLEDRIEKRLGNSEAKPSGEEGDADDSGSAESAKKKPG